MRVDGAHFERMGHLRPIPLAGGDRAAQQPWRMAAAAMLARRLNGPPSSGMGRVFDAAAGLLGLCTHNRFEAQAAMQLEQAATQHIEQHGWPKPKKDGWTLRPKGQLDYLPLLASLSRTDEQAAEAARVHATLVAGLATWVR